MKAIGQWNAAWDPRFRDRSDVDGRFIGDGREHLWRRIMPPKDRLLSIAFDASFTHVRARHRQRIQNALKDGRLDREIFEGAEICVARDESLPILARSCVKSLRARSDGEWGK